MKTFVSRAVYTIFATVLLVTTHSVGAATNTPIACSADLAAYQCNTCFDGGFLYEGREKNSLYDIVINNGSLRNFYFADENSAGAVVLNNRGGSAVTYTTPEFDYDTEFFTFNRTKWPTFINATGWAPITHPDGTVKWAAAIEPGQSYKWISTKPNKELYVTTVNKSQITDTNRALIRDENFVVVYSLTAQFRNTATASWQGSNIHRECQVIGTHFCGDGLVDSAYETCDPVDPTKSGWGSGGCNTSCQPITVPILPPSCDSISATPTFGTSPFTTTLTCNGSNLPTGSTYTIDCGNGSNAVMTGNTGICAYTNTSTTASTTYVPKCTINSTTTSPACQTIIGVNPAPTPGVCSTTLTGPQSSPITAGQCNIGTPTGFASTVVGTTTNYSWSCTGLNGGATSPTCSASYMSVVIPPVCSTTLTGPQSSPITAGQCDVGTPTGFASTVVGTTTNYSWSCTGLNGGATSPTCSASYMSVVIPPVCSTTLTGPQSSPITAGQCDVGTPTGFASTVVGTTTNYSWSCNTTSSISCSASYSTTTPPTSNFDLSIKKYAKSEDVFASIDATENFNYTIVVRNNGTGAVTGMTTVRDRLPGPIVLRAIPSGNDWTCTGTVGGADFTCTTNKSYAANTEFDVITVPVQVTSLAFRPEGYMNYAYVHNPQEADGHKCNANGSMPNPALGGNNGQTPRAVCNEDNNNFDPATVNPPNPTGFDLRLKKFVNGDDESSAVRPGTTAVYTFTMQNLGAIASSGTTTVTDTDFPAGTTIASIATTQGDWTCTQLSGTGFSCTMTRSLVMGEYATPITLTVNIASSIAVGTYRNVACLSNPFDPNEVAVLDPSTGRYKVNNCDPAEVVIVPAGTFDLSIKKYVADITTGTPQRDGDHQTTNDGTDVNRDILTIPQSGSVRYRFVVRNEGPVTATGTTNVEDTLPNGFTITGSVVGTGWTCTQGTNGNRSFSCTRTENLAVGSSFPEIIVNARSDSAILAGEYSNTATVRNPGDTNPANNTDPANVEIVVGVPSCGTITGSNAGNVSPGTSVIYSCSALNYTGALSNLQYQINCGTGTGSWASSNTGSCIAPATSSTTIPVTCAVRDLTNSSVLFSGSLAGSCSTTLTTTGGGGGGASHVGPSCVNSLKVCALYNSLPACEAVAGVGNCDSADASGQARCAAKTLVCSGGGGPSPGGPSNPYGRCGDGVLHAGEECDVVGAAWCVSCKLDLWTNPGANPITDLWMTIPALSNTTKFGLSSHGKFRTSFSSGVVIGMGGKVFTLADTVGFGIRTQYAIPLMIEADKKICLAGSGSVDDKVICTTFGEAATSDMTITKFTRPTDSKKYIILGKGDYQYQTSIGGAYTGRTANSASDIDLFRGPVQYQVLGTSAIGPTLNSTFQGTSVGRGDIGLVSCSGTDCSRTATVTLATLPVRVSGAIVGTTGTPVNRSIESFVNHNTRTILAGFGIGNISGTTTTSTTTNSSSNLGNISVNGATVGNISVSRLDLIPALNGNQNIRAIKGNLTIENCANNNTFVMEGVRTVIVEDGNIIFKCNTAYPSNDRTSSWAWIVKGGNIQVYNGAGTPNVGAITNLAGVYVAIGNTTTSGKFEGTGSITTNTILRIDGSLYGNAKPLFDSRLYARGTSAYDILTTGTIISYSNRALVNPPPLLSQYLNNYNVERVVK